MDFMLSLLRQINLCSTRSEDLELEWMKPLLVWHDTRSNEKAAFLWPVENELADSDLNIVITVLQLCCISQAGINIVAFKNF